MNILSKRNIVNAVLVAACILLVGAISGMAAVTLTFDNITGNNLGDAAIGEAQLSVVVDDPNGTMDLNADQVLFTFQNAGPDASSITDVYFDDGSLLGIADLIDADDNGGDPGVDFSEGASPGNLPGGNNANPSFQATAGFTADSDPPAQPNGVNPGETLGIIFDLQGTQTLADVYDELATGELRIGIHVQGFASGGSESFVNNPVPEPSQYALLAAGLGLAIVFRRRQKAVENAA